MAIRNVSGATLLSLTTVGMLLTVGASALHPQGHSCYYYIKHIDQCDPSPTTAGFEKCMACAEAQNISQNPACTPATINASCHGVLPPSPPSPPSPGSDRPLRLTLLNSTDAVCLDGSQAGYYYRPGLDTNISTWLLVLHGGGWCTSIADCQHRAKTALGSSHSWANTTTQLGILNADPTLNPDFYGVSAVYLYYCDGFSFTGDRDGVVEGLHFRGRRILDAIMEDLLQTKGLENAKKVLLSGHSAGGLATYLHADHVGETLRNNTGAGRDGTLVFAAAPDAGYFMHLSDEILNTTITMTQLQNSQGNTACEAAQNKSGNPRWRCFFPELVFPFIRASLFVVNSLYDPYQLTDTLGLDCSPNGTLEQPKERHTCNVSEMIVFQSNAKSVRASMVVPGGLLDPMRPLKPSGGDGAFLPSCVCHTEMYYNFGHTEGTFNNPDWKIPATIGVTPMQAISKWWSSMKPVSHEESDHANLTGLSEHFHVDVGSWPSNAPCAKFGVPSPL